jgi:hypothetical protein
MTTHKPDTDGLLEMFAVAYRRDPGQLAVFCAGYPDLARQFLGLAHEMALQGALASDTPLDAREEAWIAEACAVRNTPPTDPFAALKPQAYVAVRQALDVPGVVVNAFRDRMVAATTVPLDFLENMAFELRTSLVEFARYLEGPPKMARATSHKADVAPEAPTEKMSFEEILTDAGVPAERRQELLSGTD